MSAVVTFDEPVIVEMCRPNSRELIVPTVEVNAPLFIVEMCRPNSREWKHILYSTVTKRSNVVEMCRPNKREWKPWWQWNEKQRQRVEMCRPNKREWKLFRDALFG